MSPSSDADANRGVSGGTHEIERKTNPDREHEQPEQEAQPLAAHLLSGAGAELRPGHSATIRINASSASTRWLMAACMTVAEAMVTSVSTIEVPMTVAVGTRST